MIFSENRCPLFGIMLYRRRASPTTAVRACANRPRHATRATAT